MATPTDLLLLTWAFQLNRAGTVEDIAEFSIATHEDGFEADQAGLNAITAGAEKAWSTHASTVIWSTNVTLTSTIGTQFKADGTTLRKSVYVPAVPWQGSHGGSALPWETSLAMSLYCYPRGSFEPEARRKRGRFYLPPMSAAYLDTSNSGYFNNSDFVTLLSAMQAFVGDVGKDVLGVQHTTAGVYSRVDGVVRDAIQLSGDAKFDSQRRRQNREEAGHLELPL